MEKLKNRYFMVVIEGINNIYIWIKIADIVIQMNLLKSEKINQEIDRKPPVRERVPNKANMECWRDIIICE